MSAQQPEQPEKAYVVIPRWLVRQEVVRHTRFGEHRGDVVRWTVRRYVEPIKGEREISPHASEHGSLAGALASALDHCASLYRCRHPERHDHPLRRR